MSCMSIVSVLLASLVIRHVIGMFCGRFNDPSALKIISVPSGCQVNSQNAGFFVVLLHPDRMRAHCRPVRVALQQRTVMLGQQRAPFFQNVGDSQSSFERQLSDPDSAKALERPDLA